MSTRRSINSSASEDRLERLIAERLSPGADREVVDRRIWDLFGEDWCVMFTDLAGFSRRVAEFGIIHFLQTIFEAERILVPVIEAHDGILLKVEGDSMLVIFRNPRKALRCAVAMQRALVAYDEGLPEEDKVLLCVGLGYGRILRIGDADVFGAEVNAASKLGEDRAKAWEIIVTGSVRSALAEPVEGEVWDFEDLQDPPSGCSSIHRLRYELRG